MKFLPRLLTGSVVMATGILGTAAFSAPAYAEVPIIQTVEAFVLDSANDTTDTLQDSNCQGGGNCCVNHPTKSACAGVDCSTDPANPECQPAR